MNEIPTPPSWVRKRAGGRVPFDADKISQSLFAATESLGQPNAFLARELTDGILHFLAVEKDDDTLTTEQIGDLVTKTVRELGQPALAAAFAAYAEQRERRSAARETQEEVIVLRAERNKPPRTLIPELVRDYARQAIYSRHLLAAQSEGLLTLTGLQTPGELEACVIGPFERAAAALEALRRSVGHCAAFDGPEYALLSQSATTGVRERFVQEVTLAARLLDLEVIVNLNSAEPPPWAGDLAQGPLFGGENALPDEALVRTLSEALLEGLTAIQTESPSVCLHWHLGERDFAAAGAERLQRIVDVAARRTALTFVFDRPRRPLLLGEGLDRQHSAVLLTVGLQLPQLAAQAGLEKDAPLFLQKLGSLARLAISAAVQKREYLRRLERGQPSALTTGFLLERARLVVEPVGLDDVVTQLTGRGLTSGGAALDLGKQIVMRLRDVLKHDGRLATLETCVEGATARPATAALKNQLRAAGVLHAAAERGTWALSLSTEESTPTKVAECLRQAWQTSEVARLTIKII